MSMICDVNNVFMTYMNACLRRGEGGGGGGTISNS